MHYTTIKNLLKHHIKKNINSLWIWKKEEKEFKMIWENYSGNHRIYTTKQLLKTIEDEILL